MMFQVVDVYLDLIDKLPGEDVIGRCDLWTEVIASCQKTADQNTDRVGISRYLNDSLGIVTCRKITVDTLTLIIIISGNESRSSNKIIKRKIHSKRYNLMVSCIIGMRIYW